MSKQALENYNCSEDSWKKHATKVSSRGRSNAYTNRSVIECHVSIHLINTETGKLFHTNRNLVQQCKKEHPLSDVLIKPND